MLQYLSITRKPGFLPCRDVLAACSCLMILTFMAGAGHAANMVRDVTTESTGEMHTVHIMTSADPAYTVYELFNPPRIVVDIADVALTAREYQVPSSLPFSLEVSEVSAEEPGLARFEFSFAEEYGGYNVETVNNDIVLSINSGKQAAAGEAAMEGGKQPAAPATDQVGSLIAGRQDVESQLPQVAIGSGETVQGEEKKSPGESLKRSFSFGDYNKQRISVDFYKIDLHNVFRLFREISALNIVVDEAVSGSLTLALNDVPWDFALDIILNLKDLQKEERYNTIVILPRNKEFSWPRRAEDNLSFQADEDVAEQQAIVIQQQLDVPPEVAEAKKIIQQGRQLEKQGSYLDALKAYLEAYSLWPDNDKLANKISSLYLVYLNNNAKAVHYAKEALKLNGENATAALNAAIALANMQEYENSQQYFDQSVSISEPSKEALLSYAIFSENREQYAQAVKLLEKYDDLYGESLDSMIAHARILDKQGRHEAAAAKYEKILLAGFRIPPDLESYIKSRIALNQSL